jgi:hypothetical protein
MSSSRNNRKFDNKALKKTQEALNPCEISINTNKTIFLFQNLIKSWDVTRTLPSSSRGRRLG